MSTNYKAESRFPQAESWKLLTKVCIFISILSSGERKLCFAALLALCAAQLVPIWAVRWPPLLDYPNHLARSFVLAHINDAHYQFAQWFRADWGPYPYLAMDGMLVGLQHLCSANVAGKIFLSLCAVCVPLGAWLFVRAANPGNDWLALWGAFLSLDTFFLQGFVNFQLGLGACFAVLALAVACVNAPRWWKWLLLAICATGLYFVHLIAFGICGFILFVYALSSRRAWRTVLGCCAIFVPGVLFFLIARPGLKNPAIEFRAVEDKLTSLFSVSVHGYSNGLDNFFVVAIAACIIFAAWRNPEFRASRPWTITFLALMAAYWLVPYGWGETYDIDVRLIPALLILLLVVANIGKRQRRVVVIAIALTLIRVGSITANFRSAHPQLQAMADATSLIEPNSRVLPIIETPDSTDVLARPYAHFWAQAVIQRGAFSPYLFDIPGQTPLRMTTDTYSPDGFWDLHYDDVPDWSQVAASYDYIWAYDVDRFTPAMKAIATPLYVSGKFTLWRVNRETQNKNPPQSRPSARSGQAPSTELHEEILKIVT